jgi:hypothetical protein
MSSLARSRRSGIHTHSAQRGKAGRIDEWWIQAEVLASVADFWANFRTDPNPGISGLCGKILDQAKRNYLSAIRSKDADQLWFDDYGWWGLAFAKLAKLGKDELKAL